MLVVRAFLVGGVGVSMKSGLGDRNNEPVFSPRSLQTSPVSMKSGLGDRNNFGCAKWRGIPNIGLNEVRSWRPEQSGQAMRVTPGSGQVSMKSGLGDRNNEVVEDWDCSDLEVSMKSGLGDRNNQDALVHSRGVQH